MDVARPRRIRKQICGHPVLDNPEKIASTGLNRAIRKARGEIIIRMDAHSTYPADYVRSCVEVLNETHADNVGGPALTRADGYIAQAIALAFHMPFATGGAKFRNPRYQGPVDTLMYGCWRKSTLERIGMFDEKLVRAQDCELNARLLPGGGTSRQSPKITSWYRPRASLSAPVLAILSVRILESCGGSEAWQARILAKSCAGFLLAREPFCCFAPRLRASADQSGGETCSLPTGLRWSACISSPRSPLLFLSRSGKGGPSLPACPLFSLLTICPTRSVLFWPCCIVPRPGTAQIPFGKSLQPSQDNF